ncbi:MAG: hypothetical protein RL026_733 [Pseudomonadota bacterium]
MNRRQWLASASTVVGLLPVAAVATPAGAHAGSSVLWLADPRYPQSLRLARQQAAAGHAWLAFGADLQADWAAQLAPRLAATPGLQLAGLTAWSEFLVLRDLARGHGVLRAQWAWDDARVRRAPGERAVRLALWRLSPR